MADEWNFEHNITYDDDNHLQMLRRICTICNQVIDGDTGICGCHCQDCIDALGHPILAEGHKCPLIIKNSK